MRKKKRKEQTIRSAPSNRKGKPPKKKAARKKKAPVKSRVDKPRNGGKWSEAMFWQSIRSALRNRTRFWFPKLQALEAVRRPSQSENKRLKWEFQCHICQNWHPQKDVECHHSVEAGTLKCAEDLPGFVERLFAENGWQVLCKKCHKEHHDKSKKISG